VRIAALVLLAIPLALGGCSHGSGSDDRQRAAAVALSKMSAPAGTNECSKGFQARATGMLCWRGAADIKMTTKALGAELQRLGSSDARGACVARQSLLMCQVSGRLMGETVRIAVGPDRTAPKPSGVFVSGGLDDAAISAPDLPRWPSVPL
jgi:hypothetical protein